MSQGVLATIDDDGAGYIAQVNAALARLATKGSGTSRPSDIATYETWIDTDTPGAGIGTLYLWDGTTDIRLGKVNTSTHAFIADDATLVLPKGFVSGNTYGNGSDAANDIDLAAGLCVDTTGARWISGGALTKQLDAAWAVGTAAGGLDTGSIGNNDYWIHRILRSDTGVVDALFSLSRTSPTLPSGYDYFGLVGWFKREGGAITALKTYEMPGGGLKLKWAAPRSDVDLDNTLTTTRRTDVLSGVPLGISVQADVVVSAYDGSAGGYARVMCPDETDAAPTSPLGGTGTADLGWVPSTWVGQGQRLIETDTSGRLAARSTVATTDYYTVVTNGFVWNRR